MLESFYADRGNQPPSDKQLAFVRKAYPSLTDAQAGGLKQADCNKLLDAFVKSKANKKRFQSSGYQTCKPDHPALGDRNNTEGGGGHGRPGIVPFASRVIALNARHAVK